MRLITILICAISTQAVVLFLTINLLHYSGGAPDIFMSTGYTLENCQNYCLAAQSNNPPCVAVSFYTPPSSSTGTCYAKSQGGIDSGSSVAFDAGWRFSFYKYQVTTLYGLSFNGYTTSSVTGNTKEECVASCLQLTTCRSVLFSDSNGCVGKEYLNFNILANGYLIIVGRSLTTTTSTTTSTKTSTTSSSTSTATTSTTSKVITSDTSTTSSSTSTTTTSATSSTMSSTTSSSPIDTGTSRTTTTTIYSRISVAVTVTTADIAIPFSSATSSSFALTTTETLKLPSTSTQFVAIKISTETASSFTSIHSITASATSITTEATTIPSLTSLYTFTAQLFTNSGSSTFRTSVCTPSSSSSSVSECTSISCSSPTSLSRTEQTFSSKGTSGFFITHVATTSTFSSTVTLPYLLNTLGSTSTSTPTSTLVSKSCSSIKQDEINVTKSIVETTAINTRVKQPNSTLTIQECNILVKSFPSVAYPFECLTIEPNGRYRITGLKNQRRRDQRDELSFHNINDKYVLFSEYRVSYIVLPRMGLSQTIPSSISAFGMLQVLDLSGNQIVGNIPTVFGLLTSLQTINLAQNEVTGSIPAELGRMIGLTPMDLSGNQLSGGIPAQLSQLSNMRSMSLMGNQLTGAIPDTLLLNIAAKGIVVNFGTNCLAGTSNQRIGCSRKIPNCRAISLDSGYLDSRWTFMWSALAAVENDLNAFDKAVSSLGAEHFGVREYEFQAFKYYVQRRAWCIAKHPEYVYLG